MRFDAASSFTKARYASGSSFRKESAFIDDLTSEIAKVIVGQTYMVEDLS